MTIPNMISLLRIMLMPVFACFYLEGEHSAAMLILTMAAVSDMLDGFIARRFNMISPLGKVLDPVADKLLQLAMLLCLVRRSPVVLPLLLLHLMRELGLFTLGALCYRRRGLLIGSHWYGKLCTALLYGFLGLALLWADMPERLLSCGLCLCAAFIVYCIFRYGAEYLSLLKEDMKKCRTAMERGKEA